MKETYNVEEVNRNDLDRIVDRFAQINEKYSKKYLEIDKVEDIRIKKQSKHQISILKSKKIKSQMQKISMLV